MTRIHWLRKLTLALLLSGLVGHLTKANAQIFNIFPVNQVWTYNETDCLDGTGWEQPGYIDAAWPSGPGGFTGGETAAALLAQCNTTTLASPPASTGRARYFRTHFNVASVTDLSLILSNAIDDGAVIYLNGTSIAGLRIAAGAACTAFSGGAIGAGTDAQLWEVVTRSPAQLAGILVPGDNVLAVEVHQNNGTSSDLVFAMVLNGQLNAPPPPPPIVFTNSAGPITFDTAPPVQQWSTRTWAGAGAAPNDAITLDAAAITNDASTINVDLASAGGNPPAQLATGTYAPDAGAQYVQTRPTGVAYSGIMATLTNRSGGNLSGINLSYTFTVANPTAEQVLGHLVYYSLNGTTWVQIPSISNQALDNTAGTYSKSAEVDFAGGQWAADSKMYFLWVDDNGDGQTDGAIEIDNVLFTLPAPPVITDCSSITNQTVLQCRSSATMSVVAIGGRFQWVHNGTDIPGATASSYTITNMQSANAGSYSVRAENSLGSTSCPPAMITFAADTIPPTLLYAIGSTDLVTITLSFSEPINTNNLDAFNYYLTNMTSMAQVGISDVAAPNQLTLVLTTEPRDPTATHNLGLSPPENPIADTCAGNNLAPMVVPVYGFNTALVPLNGVWRYNDLDIDPGADWFLPGYNDSGSPWASGAGPFDSKRGAAGSAGADCRDVTLYGLGPVGTCIKLTSPVTGTNLITANFRKHFTFLGTPANTYLRLNGKVDDGAVIYLNGSELQRLRMSNAPAIIARSSFATTTVNDGDAQDNILYLSPSSLQVGDNVLAVEAHQVNLTGSDMTMGFELWAITPTPLAQPPHMTITYNPGTQQVTINWNPGGGTLQASTDLVSWADIAGSSGVTISSTTPAYRFFRVKQ